MRILISLSLAAVYFTILDVHADELGGALPENVSTPTLRPKKRPRYLTIEDIINEYEREEAANISIPKTRPRIRPVNLPFKAPIPIPRPGLLKEGEYYKNPEGLPGIYVLFNPSCQNFIKKDGSIGPWGKEFLKAMKNVDRVEGTNCFNGGIDFGQRCPGFKNLNKSEKDHVWVWLWASTAQAESSCQPDAQATGIKNEKFGRYNTADGLMQLEYRTETRDANGRDKHFCPDNSNTQALEFQARCSAHIMARKQCPGYLKNNESYWLKMRKNNGTIWDLLKKHPLCKGV